VAAGKGRLTLAAENRPLSGRRIVITRPTSQARAFARAIEELGGEVVEFPTIEIVPPLSYDPLDRAIKQIESYHWLVFTSVNGVSHFWGRFLHLKRERRALKEIKIAAIGPQTARELESVGLAPDLVPEEYRAEAMLEKLEPAEIRGKRVLLPRAAAARDVLPETLRRWGAEVDIVEAYRTVAANGDGGWLQSLLLEKKIDMITFTSSSTVTHFSALLSGTEIEELLARCAVACIGPITQRTAEETGIKVDVVAKEYTVPGLTRALTEYFKMQSEK
jgi:uroporphyrinogen III methyltransferase/synthase